MHRVGVSFKSSLTADQVHEQYIQPLRAAVEEVNAGFYSNYLRQTNDDPGPAEHLLVFQVFDFQNGLRLLRTRLQDLESAGEVLFHNLDPSDPMY